MRNKVSHSACTTSLGNYSKHWRSVQRNTICSNLGNFYIELIIVIGSSSISTFSKFKKVRKRKAIYIFQKLSCSNELEMRILYVSPEFANSVSGGGLHSSFLRAFALTPTVMLFFGLFPRIQYPFLVGVPDGGSVLEYRSYQRLKEARKLPITTK